MKKPTRVALASITATGLAAGLGTWLCTSYLPSRALQRGEQLKQAGLTALAEEEVDCHRKRLVKSQEGCRTLLHVYHLNRNGSRLQWASESCLQNGIRIAEAYLGLATALQAAGRDGDTVSLLTQGVTEHPEEGMMPLELGKVYLRNKQIKEAERAFNLAAKKSRNKPRILAEVIGYFIEAKNLTRAKQLAQQLASYAEQDESLKPLAAELLERAGDAAKAAEIRKSLAAAAES